MTQTLVSGIQPTGSMHLGNYMGAVKNWVDLQEKYNAYFLIVDYHSLTTSYENPEALREAKFNLAVDLLACGVDPEKAHLFFQSDVPEHTELHLYLSMITPLPWLERVPTYKDKMNEIKEKDLNTYGFLGYPVLQTADIMLYRGETVPVGKDQLPHIELAREITRRFNHLYKADFPEPQELLKSETLLSGIDGRKMSKSYGNTISVTEDVDSLSKKVMKMYTDPKHIHVNDPGQVEGNVVFEYLTLFDPNQDELKELKDHYRRGGLGDVILKRRLIDILAAHFQPFRERREALLTDEDFVFSQLKKGAAAAREVAQKNIQEVKNKIGL